MRQTINIQNIPDIISLTQLRYKTNFLLQKLLKEEKPLILVKRSKKVAVIYPLRDNIGEKQQDQALKIKAYPLEAPKKIKRAVLYGDYLKKKLQ